MNLARILENLTRWIPRPRRPAPVEQQSFAGLKLGQRLQNTAPLYVGEIDTLLQMGSLWTVTRTTDQFAEVRSEHERPVTVRLFRDWREEFMAVPKRTRKAVK